MAYVPPALGVADASWAGEPAYSFPDTVLWGDWTGTVRITPAGIASLAMGTPERVTKQQFVDPDGFVLVTGKPLVTLDYQYIPPYVRLDVDWTKALAYTPATLGSLSVAWHIVPPAKDVTLYPRGIDSAEFGSSLLWQYQYIDPVGFYSPTKFGYTRIYREGEYLPPYRTLDASWVGAEAYTLPDGYVAGAWRRRPEGKITELGWDSVVSGTARVENWVRTLEARGKRFGTFGSPELVLGSQSFTPGSIKQDGYGKPTVENLDRYIYLPSINPPAIQNNNWVSLGTRRIKPGLGVQTGWGTATMSGGVRWLDLAGRGIASVQMGKPTAWFSERQIYPRWFVASLYGTPMVDFNYDVAPESIDAGAFGQADVHVPRDYIELTNKGIAGPLWGNNRVSNYTRHILPDGVLPAPTFQEQFGRGEVYLWTRYIKQLFEVTPYDGGTFSRFNSIENRDKVLRPEGIKPPQLGLATVANNARIVTTPAYVDMSLWGDTMVSHYIRYLPIPGTDTSVFGNKLNMIVYNDGRVLAPAGIEPAGVGKPDPVWSNLQTIKPLGADQSLHGTQFVSWAIRTVAPFRMQDPPPFGLTVVQNWERYVQPQGLDAGGHGVATVEEHFTIFAPRSILPLVGQVGESGRVHNNTPELGQQGAVQTLWGDTHVFLQYRHFAMQGFGTVLFGNAVVADRTKHIAPRSMLALTIPVKNEVRNVIPVPPGQTPVQVQGIGAPQFSAGTVVRSNVLFVQQPDSSTLWGTPGVVSMGIMPLSILPPYDVDTGSQFGIPTLPGAQTITTVQRYPATQWGDAAFSPFYIWAPQGYPFLVDPGDLGHPIDFFTFGGRSERPVFGRNTTVTLQNRTIKPRHNQLDNDGVFVKWGTARASLNPQVVHAQGKDFRRLGIPTVNAGGVAEATGFEHSAYGLPVVAFAPYLGPQTLAMQGIKPAGFGTAYVDYFNRFLTPQGWTEFKVSVPAPPSWPRKSTWVSNAYPPFPVEGFDASLFGTAWISHRIRAVYPQGSDMSIVADYVPGHFADRMRVRQRTYAGAGSLGDMLAFGAVRVEQGVRGFAVGPIRPAGAGRPQVHGANTINPDGIDASVFGDVQKWEAGKIKPHGDDMAALGRAVIGYVLNPDGFTGSVGSPSMGVAIYPQGIAPEPITGPVATWHGCNQYALAVPSFDASAVGTPEISAGTGGPVTPY